MATISTCCRCWGSEQSEFTDACTEPSLVRRLHVFERMKNTLSRLIQILFLSTCTSLFATNARAQIIDSAVAHVGFGVGMNFYNPTNSDGKSSQGFGIAYRWHGFHSGWSPTFGLDWHTTDFTQTVGSVDAPLGALRMRAVLAGYGYTRHIKNFAVSGSANAGYSFNDLSVDGGLGPAFASAGQRFVEAHVDNSLLVKPQVSAWYDLAKHIGVGVGAAYLVSRPEEVVTTAAGSSSRHLQADTFELTAGLTFGVWRQK